MSKFKVSNENVIPGVEFVPDTYMGVGQVFTDAIDDAVQQAIMEASQEGLIRGHEEGAAWVRLLNRRFHRISIVHAARQGMPAQHAKPRKAVTPEDVVRALEKRPELLEGVKRLLGGPKPLPPMAPYMWRVTEKDLHTSRHALDCELPLLSWAVPTTNCYQLQVQAACKGVGELKLLHFGTTNPWYGTTLSVSPFNAGDGRTMHLHMDGINDLDMKDVIKIVLVPKAEAEIRLQDVTLTAKLLNPPG